MAAETISVDCATGVYTVLATGKVDVSFRAGPQGGRVALASSLPGPTTVDYFQLNSGELCNLGSLDTNVYYMAYGGAAQTIKVMRR